MTEVLTRSDLEFNFDNIVANYNQLRDEAIEEIVQTDTHQEKYGILDLKKTREYFDTTATHIKRVTHQDYYFLQSNTHPSYVTECICLREEKDLEVADSPVKTTLIYKSNPHTVGGSHVRTVKSVDIPEDLEGAYTVLELLESRYGEPYAQIYKERQIYLRDEAAICIDTNVIAIDGNKEQHYLGDYIEVTTSNTQSDSQTLPPNMPPYIGPLADRPYLDYAGLEKHTSRKTPLSEVSPSRAYQQMYFDWQTNTFIEQIDPSKIKQLNTVTGGRASEVLNTIADLVAHYDSSIDKSNQGNQSSKLVHETYKPFKYYRAPLNQLKDVRTFRYALDHGYRVVISAVTTMEDKKGIILHFSGTHDAYIRWVNRHK